MKGKTGHKEKYSPIENAAIATYVNNLNDMPMNIKISILASEFISQNYPHFYSQAQNLAKKLTDSVNKLFEEFDLLALPTIPFKPKKLPKDLASMSPIEVFTTAFEPIANTALFNITGHPAITIPCGLVDGLPVGLMIVGKHFNEGTIYAAASAFENHINWKNL